MPKRKRRKNPSAGGVIITLGLVAAAGGTAWYFLRDDKADKKPKGKNGKSKKDSGQTGAVLCEEKPAIPGYRLAVLDGPSCGSCGHYTTKKQGTFTVGHCDLYKDNVSAACVCDSWVEGAKADTDDQYGLVFTDGCNDFQLIEPPEGVDTSGQKQKQIMDAIVAEAKNADSFDPWSLAAKALNEMAPAACEFPPSPQGPARITQLYLYFVSLVGVVGLMEGGTIEGFVPGADPSMLALDTFLADQAAEKGYPPFDPKVVPELLPDAPEGGSQQASFQAIEIDIDELVPTSIPARVDPTDIYAKGKLPPGVEVQLLNESTLEPVEALAVYPAGEDMRRLSVKGQPGTYRAYVRHHANADWEPTDATLEIAALQAGFQPADNVPQPIPGQQGG